MDSFIENSVNKWSEIFAQTMTIENSDSARSEGLFVLKHNTVKVNILNSSVL